jgi:hypothetical protein
VKPQLRAVLSYNQLLPILSDYELKMVIARLNTDYFAEAYHRRVYLGILAQNGWTDEGFDQETLRRIDAGWDIKTPPPRGDHPMAKPETRKSSGLLPVLFFGGTSLAYSTLRAQQVRS